ncbi:MAG: OmpA family protein [Desulfobacteraceae bacterium]|nr:OmpA family protein [Desulfobacteraceae bacterium]
MLKMNDVTLRICNKYIFTGYFDKDNNLCSPLSPVTALNFMLERKFLGIKYGNQDNKYILCKTNGNGVIQEVLNRYPDSKEKFVDGENFMGRAIKTHLMGKAPKLIIPPSDLVLKVMAGYEEEKEWADKLCEIVEQSGMKGISSFKFQYIKSDQLQKPKEHPETEQDKHYKNWYEAHKKTKEFEGIIIPKTRAVFFLFSSPKFIGSTIDIFRNGKQINTEKELRVAELEYYKPENKDKIYEFQKHYGAVFHGTDKLLPSGQYKIAITPGTRIAKDITKERWKKEDGYYEFVEYIKFPVENRFCQYEVIQCDPISVEEALITQFPEDFSNVTAYRQYMEVKSEEGSNSETDKKKIPNGMQEVAKLFSTGKKWTLLGYNLAFADSSSKLAFALGNLLQKAVPDKEPKLKSSMELIFSPLLVWEKCSLLLKKGNACLKTLKSLSTLPTFKDAMKVNFASRYFFVMKEAEANEFTFAKTIAKRIKIPEYFKNTMVTVNNIAKPLNLLFALNELTAGFLSYTDNKNSLELKKVKYQNNIEDYYKKTSYVNEDFSDKNAENIYFESSDDKIKSKYKKLIEKAAAFLSKNTLDEDQNKHIVLIEGYADYTASDILNLELSLKRAKAVEKAIWKEFTTGKNSQEKENLGFIRGRITIRGFGETKAIQKGDSDQKKEDRRCDIHMFTTKKNVELLPNREGIRNLEKVRIATVLSKLKFDKIQQEAAIAALDTALAVAAFIPLTATAAGMVIVMKGAWGVGEGLLKKLDKIWLDEYFASKKQINNFSKRNHKRTIANNHLIGDEINALNNGNGEKKVFDPQFRMRSDAINALYTLMLLAHHETYDAIAASDKKIEYYKKLLAQTKSMVRKGTGIAPEMFIKNREKLLQNARDEKKLGIKGLLKIKVDKYRLDDFIRLFIINDGWLYPLNTRCKFSLADFWINAVQTQSSQENPDYEKQIFIDKLNHNNDSFYFNLYGLNSRYTWGNINFGISLEANFQQSFAIHRLISENAHELIKSCDGEQVETNGDDFIYTNIYYRKRDSHSNNDWKPVKNAKNPLSPFDHIRMIVALESKNEKEVATSSIQIKRYDEASDGIKYKKILKPLEKEELLNNEKELEGHIGCVFFPSYQFRKETIFGIKPMSSNRLLGQFISYIGWEGLADINYYLTIKVAKSLYTQLIIPFSGSDILGQFKKYKDFTKDELKSKALFKLSVDGNREHELSKKNLFPWEVKYLSWLKTNKPDYLLRETQDKFYIKDEGMLLSKGFLQERTSHYPWPELFKDEVCVTPLIKIGDSEFFNANPLFKKELSSARYAHQENYTSIKTTETNFDWNTPVEVIMVLSIQSGNEMLNYMLNPWAIFDVVLLAIFAFFIYKKSRIAATLMFIYFIISKCLLWYDLGKAQGIILTLAFMFFYFNAMRGTFLWHSKYKNQDESLALETDDRPITPVTQ